MRSANRPVSLGSARGRMSSPGRLSDGVFASRTKWAALASLLVAAIIAAALILISVQPPAPLAHYVLAGYRAPGCVRTVVFRDESGSMVQFASARADALKDLVKWSKQPHTLRSTDELAIIDFAGKGKVAESTKTVSKLRTAIPAAKSVDSSNTSFSAGILAMRSLPATKCRTSVIALSDGEIAPLTAAARTELAHAGVSNVALVLPTVMPVPSVWANAFPYGISVEAPAGNSSKTATAVATALAASMGQRMVAR